MISIANIAKGIGAAIVTAFLLIGILSNIKPAVPADVMQKSIDSEAYLASNMSNYGRCYGSVNYARSPIGKLKIEYIGRSFDVNPNDPNLSAKLNEAEAAFMVGIHEKCDQAIEDYEVNYRVYTDARAEITKASVSVFDNLTGKKPSARLSNDYQPSAVRFRFGDPLSGDFVFTEEELRRFFVNHIGY